MKKIDFRTGQSILWISKQNKAGEPQYTVPGHVIKVTAKRVAIKVLRYDASWCIRYVTAKRLRPSLPH